MITAFFKPKSTQKVTPADPKGPSTALTAKRPLDHGAKEESCNNNNNKRLKSTRLDTSSDAINELLSYVKEQPERQGDETTWNDILRKHATTASSFARLAEFVASQRYVIWGTGRLVSIRLSMEPRQSS